jgi:hypothetical protein
MVLPDMFLPLIPVGIEGERAQLGCPCTLKLWARARRQCRDRTACPWLEGGRLSRPLAPRLAPAASPRLSPRSS